MLGRHTDKPWETLQILHHQMMRWVTLRFQQSQA